METTAKQFAGACSILDLAVTQSTVIAANFDIYNLVCSLLRHIASCWSMNF